MNNIQSVAIQTVNADPAEAIFDAWFESVPDLNVPRSQAKIIFNATVAICASIDARTLIKRFERNSHVHSN